MAEHGSESGTSRSAAHSLGGWQAQPPKGPSASDRTKTLMSVTASAKKSGSSGVNPARHRGSLLKRRTASAMKSSGSGGFGELLKQQQQQQREQCLPDAEDPEMELQNELDEEFYIDEPMQQQQQQQPQQQPQQQQQHAQSLLSCGSTALSSTPSSGFQLFGCGGQLQPVGGSATLQDVSASSILQQNQKQQHQKQQHQQTDQFDVSLLMHSGFYGTREEVEKLLAQAIQLHCRPTRLTDSSKSAEGWPNFTQQQVHQPRQSPKAPTASTMGLAEDLLQAWSCGGVGTSGKSVHFSVESSSNTSSDQLPPTAAVLPQQEQNKLTFPSVRDQLLLTDFSEEEIIDMESQTDGVFLTAKPPVPKPRTERSSSLSRQGAQLAQSVSQAGQSSTALHNCNAVNAKPRKPNPRPPSLPQQPIPPTPTPRQRRSRQEAAATSILRCLPPPQPPPPQPQPQPQAPTQQKQPVPRQRRRLSESSDEPPEHRKQFDESFGFFNSSATMQQTESDEPGGPEDNATVRPDFVDKTLDHLLQTRMQLTQSSGGSGSNGSNYLPTTSAAVQQFDLANALTTARRPMEQAATMLSAGPGGASSSSAAAAATGGAAARRSTLANSMNSGR